MAAADSIAKMGMGRLIGLGAVLFAVIGVFGYMINRLPQGDMTLAYSELDLAESSKIVSKIESMGVPYEVREGGSQIFIPKDDLPKIRMSMAEAGLPTGGVVGYELFDRTDAMSSTNFVQSLNHVRALEGALARSIKSISGVANARVHIVLSKRELFSRDKQDASASVVLKMRGAGRLNQGQIQAIQHMIAAAVPGLQPQKISIVDGQGTLLARGGGDNESTTATTNQEFKNTYERKLARSIEDLLERSLGPGKVRAEVAATMDFTQISEQSELFDPEGQVVRSTQSSEDKSSSTESNQGVAISLENDLPGDQPQKTAGGTTGNRANRVDEVTNFEVSKTIRNLVRHPGEIKKLSVAVLVDGDYKINEEGKGTYTAREQKELDQISKLVKTAVGFDEARGDTIEVINMEFAKPSETMGADVEEEKIMGLAKNDFMRIVEAGVMGIVGILVLLLVVRPVVAKLMEGAKAGQGAQDSAFLPTDIQAMDQAALPDQRGNLDSEHAEALAAAEEEGKEFEKMIDIKQVEGRVKASSVKKVGEIVDRHPDEAVSIIRNWMSQDRV